MGEEENIHNIPEDIVEDFSSGKESEIEDNDMDNPIIKEKILIYI